MGAGRRFWIGESGKGTGLLRELLWLRGHRNAAASALNANFVNYYANLQLLLEPATWVAFLTQRGWGRRGARLSLAAAFSSGDRRDIGEELAFALRRGLPLELQFALP